MKTEMEACPFCDGPATREAWDRGINIGCDVCGYHRHFPGLLQRVKNDYPILEYRNADGSVKHVDPADVTEYYHQHADEEAVRAWNTRAKGKRIADLEAALAKAQEDARRLDAIAENYWKLDPVDLPTPGGDDADVGWRILQYHMAPPTEREVAFVGNDDPRAAIDAALRETAPPDTEGND